MGFKLAVPKFAIPKADSSALASTHARLKAWWDGDLAPKLEIVQSPSDSPETSNATEIDEADIHVRASAALWGDGRSFPSNAELESDLILRAGGKKASRIALFGAGTGALARVGNQITAAKIDIYEADKAVTANIEKSVKALKSSKRIGIHAFDWQPSSLPKGKTDGALFMFLGGQQGKIEAGAFCAERILRPGAQAVWIDFFARRDDETLDDCRGHDMRRFGTEEEATIAFSACGLSMRADEDWSAQYLDAFEGAWRDLAVNVGVRQAAMIKDGGYLASTAALQNLICWKARSAAIRTGKLMVRRYVLAA